MSKGKASSEPMLSGSHEEYIQCLQMNGKEAVVTPANLKQMEAKRQKDAEIRAQISGRDISKSVRDWEKEREAEEIAEEERDRAEKKKLISTKISEVAEVFSIDTSKKQETIKKEIESISTLSESSKSPAGRNYAFLISEAESIKDDEEIKHLHKGNVVLYFPHVAEAKTYIQSQLPSLQWVNLRIILHHPKSGDEVGSFISVLTQTLHIAPSVVVLCADDTDIQRMKFGGRPLHNPPYVIVTKSNSTAVAFVESNKQSMTVDEEMEFVNHLTVSAQHQTRDGRVLLANTEQDLRFKDSVSAVTKFKCIMLWKGVQDLDLSAICLAENGDSKGIVNWGSRFAVDGFVHKGDVNSAPFGACEIIECEVDKISNDIRAIYFIITSFSGAPFNKVVTLDASLHISDGTVESSFAEMPLTASGEHTAVVLCRVHRTSASSWAVTNINLTDNHARTARALLRNVQSHLADHPGNYYE